MEAGARRHADAPVAQAARSRRVPALALGCTVALLGLGVVSRLRFGFEWDELELLQSSWNVAAGGLPYRDFFEHHPPLASFVLAPVVGRLHDASGVVLVVLRLVAAAVLATALGVYVRLVRHVTSAAAARWAVVVAVATWPLAGKLFELRADWLALLALVVAIERLVDRPADGRHRAADVACGLLGGIAICLTQKALVPWAAVGAWSAGRVASARRGSRSAEAGRMAALLAGTIVAPALLACAFSSTGAAADLWRGAVAVNVGWPREVGWRFGFERVGAAAFGPLALALAAVVGRLDVRRAERPGESLLALVFAAGVAAHRLTPVPWEQSMLFFVVPWAAALALVTLERATTPDGSRDVAVTVVIAAVALAALLPRGVVRGAAVIWALPVVGVLVAAGRRTGLPLEPAIAVAVLPGILAFAADRIGDLASGRAGAQAAFASAVAAELRPGEPVLATWDHVLPFRPVATYHWFAHEGVLRRFAAADGRAHLLDEEYVRALAGGRVRVAIVDRDAVAPYLPRVDRLLAHRCRRIVAGYAGSDAYVCPGPPAT